MVGKVGHLVTVLITIVNMIECHLWIIGVKLTVQLDCFVDKNAMFITNVNSKHRGLVLVIYSMFFLSFF